MADSPCGTVRRSNTHIPVTGQEFPHLPHRTTPPAMAQAPHPIHSFPPHYPSTWRPASVDEFNTWNTSSQGIFPSVLIGPGQNPDLLPRPQRRRTSHAGAAPTNNSGKRKRTAPSPRETSSVGGFGPLSPGDTAMGMSPLGPTLPPPTSDSRRNGAHDVWAFARPLDSDEERPMDQWPTSLEPHLTSKPKSLWFGCKLCTQYGYGIVASAFHGFALICPHHRDSKTGIKQWRVFKNDENSSPTTPFRRHLNNHHEPVWGQERARLNIPINHLAREALEPRTEKEPFTKDGLLKHLVKFIASDDQVHSL